MLAMVHHEHTSLFVGRVQVGDIHNVHVLALGQLLVVPHCSGHTCSQHILQDEYIEACICKLSLQHEEYSVLIVHGAEWKT